MIDGNTIRKDDLMDKKPTTHILIYVQGGPDQKNQWKIEARKRNKSVSEIVELALEEYFKKHSK